MSDHIKINVTCDGETLLVGASYVLTCDGCKDKTKVKPPDGNPLWFMRSVLHGYTDEHHNCSRPY